MFDLVIPTLGRPSLATLLDALAGADGPRPDRILVVDDRRDRSEPLAAPVGEDVKVLQGPGRGPAAARNVGWRASDAAWVVFVDDDVVPTEAWLADLRSDLMAAPLDVVAVQGRVTVPLPTDRRPTDWERNVTGLETARWITADMAVRRSALQKVGGFDERFPRAFREDLDLAIRLQEEGGKMTVGQRRVLHPVRPAPWWVSLRLQAGNRDDALMTALHGKDWLGQEAPRGRRRRHLATTACGLAAAAGVGLRRPVVARAGLVGWAVGTAELAWARIVPGPRTPKEVAAMVATSAALPPVATWHWLAGLAARRRLLKQPGPQPASG
ncbi:MAG TPA: glycosyltransferase [Acidimicrobiales bacterium]|nr:glycosyltransferase [Acidimicrobiales bacterium]